jgi:FtsH-binding integral membrane protein
MPLATATNTAIPDSLKTTSLFKEHLLGTKSIGYKFHYTHYDYLPAGIMLFCFLVFVWLFVSNRKRLSQTVKGFYANRFASQLARKESNYGNAVTTFLTVIFVLTMTLFISKAIQYYYPQSIVTHNFVMLNIVVCGIVAWT